MHPLLGAPLPSSTGVLPAQQTEGLPAVPLHSDSNNLFHECQCAVLEGDPQHPDQQLFIPWLIRMAMMVSSAMIDSIQLFLKFCLSLSVTQDSRVLRNVG